MPQIVFYHIQRDLGSDSLHPEAFMIDKESNITIGDVVNSFPLKDFGNFHIRFRLPLRNGYLWLDPQDKTQKAPLYNGSIFLKVLNLDKLGKQSQRTSIIDSIPLNQEQQSNQDDNSINNNDNKNNETVKVNNISLKSKENKKVNKKSSIQFTSNTTDDLDSYLSSTQGTDKESDSLSVDNTTTTTTSTPTNTNDDDNDNSSINNNNNNYNDNDEDSLFEFISTPAPPDTNDNTENSFLSSPDTISASSSTNDIYQMNFMNSPKNINNQKNSKNNNNNNNIDSEENESPINTTSLMPEVIVQKAEVSEKVKELASKIKIDDSASQMTGTTYEGKDENVIQGMKEREEKLKEAQAQAVAEKLIREQEQEEQQEERAVVHSQLGTLLDDWANDAGGERKNIRTLLCTMQNVMWLNSGWTPVSMAQLLAPEKVKLYYRKAMLKVHPDKNAGCSAEQVYRAQRIFEALNQAWSKFQDQQNNTL